jgi:hypothetical protein
MLGKFVTAAIVFISGYFYWLSSRFNSVLLRLEAEGNTELGACRKHTNTLLSIVRCDFQIYVSYDKDL